MSVKNIIELYKGYENKLLIERNEVIKNHINFYCKDYFNAPLIFKTTGTLGKLEIIECGTELPKIQFIESKTNSYLFTLFIERGDFDLEDILEEYFRFPTEEELENGIKKSDKE